MKIIRFNESLNEGNPEIGDYVICNDNHDSTINDFSDIDNFMMSSIGMYVKNDYDKYPTHPYAIRFYDIPHNLHIFFNSDNTVRMKRTEIKYWTQDKKELELILKSNKFNI